MAHKVTQTMYLLLKTDQEASTGGKASKLKSDSQPLILHTGGCHSWDSILCRPHF